MACHEEKTSTALSWDAVNLDAADWTSAGSYNVSGGLLHRETKDRSVGCDFAVSGHLRHRGPDVPAGTGTASGASGLWALYFRAVWPRFVTVLPRLCRPLGVLAPPGK